MGVAGAYEISVQSIGVPNMVVADSLSPIIALGAASTYFVTQLRLATLLNICF